MIRVYLGPLRRAKCYSGRVSETTEQTRTPEELAYRAGYALLDVRWPAELDEDDPRDLSVLLTPGVHHNPFDARVPEQREEARAWLEGLRARLSAPTKDPKEILADIDSELGDDE